MQIKIQKSEETLQLLSGKLKRRERVFFIRFGDGEIISMMGLDHRNYNSSEGLSRELKESFEILHPDYLIGLGVNTPFEKHMSKGMFKQYDQNEALIAYLSEEDLISSESTYQSQICFHYLSVFNPKIVYDFLERYVRPKKTLFIGSTNPKTVKKIYGENTKIVKIPSRHAYDTIDEWWPKVEALLSGTELILPSAGAASNVIAKRLWQMDTDHQLLDIGSLVDAIENKTTRTWIRLMGHRVQKILPAEYRNTKLKFRFISILKDIRYFFRKYLVQ